MNRDDILRQIEGLKGRLQSSEQPYITYLRALVKADAAIDEAFRADVLSYIGEPQSLGIKDWVLRTVYANEGKLNAKGLRALFLRERGPANVNSLRQYLTKRHGLVRHDKRGMLYLRKEGKDQMKE